MHITTKGQVTIPQEIRNHYGFKPHTEVDFVAEEGRVYLVKGNQRPAKAVSFKHLVGTASVKMSTDEIMRLTRGGE